jgi:hypothetical protein
VRRQLAEPAKGNVDRTDRTALAAFYGERNEPLLWVTSAGFTLVGDWLTLVVGPKALCRHVRSDV